MTDKAIIKSKCQHLYDGAIPSFLSTTILMDKNTRPITVKIGAIRLNDAKGKLVTTTPPIKAPKALPKLKAD